MGPYYQAFPEGGSLTIYEDDPSPHPRAAGEVVQEGRRRRWPKWNAWLEGIADVMGPLLTQVPPNIGSHRPSDLFDLAKLGWTPARDDHPHDGRRHPAADHEHRRPARRLVRITASQRRARGQRRHRHLGRPVRARHRLRDGAPLDRRRRRRPAGQLGLSRGRHGRRVGGDRATRPAASEPRSAPTPGFPEMLVRDGRVQRRGAGERRRDPRRRWSSPRCIRKSRSSTMFRAPSCPRTSSATSSIGRPAAAS